VKTCGHDNLTIDTGSVRLCQECARLPQYARKVRAIRRRLGLVVNEEFAVTTLDLLMATDNKLSCSERLRSRTKDVAIAALEELELGNVAIAKRLGAFALKARRKLKEAGIDL